MKSPAAPKPKKASGKGRVPWATIGAEEMVHDMDEDKNETGEIAIELQRLAGEKGHVATYAQAVAAVYYLRGKKGK